jgi:type I restriction enzyme S subunit
MVGLRPDQSLVLPSVLSGILGTVQPQKYLDHRTTDMAESQVNFANDVLLGTSIYVPPLPEQHRIAEILDTLDEAIRKTGQVIANLQQMKQGLLHDLLTRGIDENGELRDPERHPELFKDSLLGRIPRGWETMCAAQLMQPGRKVTYGIVQPGHFSPGGALLVRGQDYINGWQPVETFFRVSTSLHHQYSRSTILPGDALITIVGATTGATAVVPEWISEANITQTTARLAFDNSRLLSTFGSAFISSSRGQDQLRRFMKGSAQPGLNLADVEKFVFPVPSVPEQHIILGFLATGSSRDRQRRPRAVEA